MRCFFKAPIKSLPSKDFSYLSSCFSHSQGLAKGRSYVNNIYSSSPPEVTTAENAMEYIHSHSKVFIHSASAAPQHLIKHLAQRGKERPLRNVTVYQLHTEGEAPYASEDLKDAFHVVNFFVGPNNRESVQSGQSTYIPMFLHEIPLLFRRKMIELDVALITVSPPDHHGFCSLGTSVDVSLAAVQCARTVIAQINSHMPRTHGDGIIHINSINTLVHKDEPLPEHKIRDIDNTTDRIAENVASLVENGSTLQMGIGAIPDATLTKLHDRKGLGIHTEMFSDSVIDLVLKGVITGEHKKVLPSKITSSFIMGSKRLYDFVDENPMVELKDVQWVNNVNVIAQNPKVVAINSAIEIDITGQVCADSVGAKIYSGVGGQMDFIRGATLSEGGKPIIAMPSITHRGRSKIVPYLQPGAGVVTTRAHVHYVVTENGIANLWGKSLEERMALLIGLAHPSKRAELEQQATQFLCKSNGKPEVAATPPPPSTST